MTLRPVTRGGQDTVLATLQPPRGAGQGPTQVRSLPLPPPVNLKIRPSWAAARMCAPRGHASRSWCTETSPSLSAGSSGLNQSEQVRGHVLLPPASSGPWGTLGASFSSGGLGQLCTPLHVCPTGLGAAGTLTAGEGRGHHTLNSCTYCRPSSDFRSPALGEVHFPPANVHLPPPTMGVNQLGQPTS